MHHLVLLSCFVIYCISCCVIYSSRLFHIMRYPFRSFFHIFYLSDMLLGASIAMHGHVCQDWIPQYDELIIGPWDETSGSVECP